MLNNKIKLTHCSFKRRKKTLKHVLQLFMHCTIIMLLILLTSQEISGHVISSSQKILRKQNIPDMLCNVGDEHECVCLRSIGNLDGKNLPCTAFLEVSFI